MYGGDLILEQKETKKTKNFKIGNWSACDFLAILEVGTTRARPWPSRPRQKRRLVSVDLVNHTPRVKWASSHRPSRIRLNDYGLGLDRPADASQRAPWFRSVSSKEEQISLDPLF